MKVIKLIDIDAAVEAMSHINVGDTITLTLDSAEVQRKVIDKTLYSVTLQGPTNKLTVPVEFTAFYKEAVMRMPTATDEPKKPGRPRKAASAAPVEQPQPPQPTQAPAFVSSTGVAHQYLPPGYNPATLAGTPPGVRPNVPYSAPQPTQGGGFPQATQPPQPTPTAALNAEEKRASGDISGFDIAKADLRKIKAQRIEAAMDQPTPTQVTIEQAEGEANWIEASMEEALDIMREHLMTLIEGAKKEALESIPQQTATVEAKKSCLDCIYVNKEGNICAKFNMVPPMFVVVDPKTNCPEFTDGADIPY